METNTELSVAKPDFFQFSKRTWENESYTAVSCHSKELLLMISDLVSFQSSGLPGLPTFICFI